MNIDKDFGIQSWCFRSFKTNEEVADLVKECGLSAIELCGIHADFADEKQFAKVVDIYKKKGVRIASIGVQTFGNKPDVERKNFEFAKLAGAKEISIHFDLAA